MKLVAILIGVCLTAVTALNLRGHGRVTNGETARQGQFPYQVKLKILRQKSGHCGGSLIDKNWVLTAAHCTLESTKIDVLLGSIYVDSPLVIYTVLPEDIFTHPKYMRGPRSNDIALIRIPTVDFSPDIQPVKLPTITSYNPNYYGETVIASGWGLTEANQLPNDLRYLKTTIIPQEECRRSLGQEVRECFTCVLTMGGVSTCKGDSGGPLVLESTGVQVGITAFGSNMGCELGMPGAFTRVTSYMPWIKEVTGIEDS